MPQYIDNQKIIRRLKQDEYKIKCLCNFVETKSANEIVKETSFWVILHKYCDTVLDHVRTRNYDIVNKYFLEWINLLKLTVSKDFILNKKLVDGPLKPVFAELLVNADKEYPNWFIKTFFNSLLVYFQFSDDIINHLFNAVRGAISYSSQESFLHVIITNFDHDLVYKYMRNVFKNKEIHKLFNILLEECNDQGRIRNFINCLNLYENPGKVFSFISSNVKLRGLLLVKNTWIDLNIRSNTITFSAKKSDLCNEEECQYLTNEEDLFDVVTMKISHISYVRFKSGSDDNEDDELSFELTRPLRTLYESSTEFLKNYRVVSIYIADSNERQKAFLYNYFGKKAEGSIDNSNPDNYEFELVHSDSPNNSSIDLSATDTTQSQSFQMEEENDNIQNVEHEIDENLIIDGSGSDNRKYNSILQTPEPRASANISVDESTAPNSQDSICNDSVSSSYEYTHFKSAIFATPVPKSTNVSVAASYDTPNNPSTQDSGICKEETRRYNSIRARTPEITNQLPIEVINLVSPEIVSKDNKYEQTDKSNEIESVESVHPHPEPKEICQNPVTEPNIIKTAKAISKKRLSNVTDVSEASQQTEDDRQSHNSSCVSRGTQVSSESTRKSRKRKTKTYDETAEFAETSFFSDKETTENVYTYTKTRVVRKHRPFQYNTDTGPNQRRAKKINKTKVSEAENTDVDEPPPAKIVRTLLPCRPSNTTAETNVNKVKKIISNINSVNHLAEEPTEPAFRISVPRNSENAGQNEEIQSHINTANKKDKFDMLLNNEKETQQSPQNKIHFLSSLSSLNSDNQANIQNRQIQNQGQNAEKDDELGSKNTPNSSQNSTVQNKKQRKNAQKVVVNKRGKKKPVTEKVTKNKKNKKDLIEEHASGDHKIRNFAETNQVSFEQAFRQLMPQILSGIQNICEGWTLYASDSDKKKFRDEMKKYFT